MASFSRRATDGVGALLDLRSFTRGQATCSVFASNDGSPVRHGRRLRQKCPRLETPSSIVHLYSKPFGNANAEDMAPGYARRASTHSRRPDTDAIVCTRCGRTGRMAERADRRALNAGRIRAWGT